MSLQDFFEGTIRTATVAANAYLDAEIAYLKAEDAISRERARNVLVEERNKLLRQKESFDRWVRIKEFQSAEETEKRRADEEARKADRLKTEDEARKTNVTNFGTASLKFSEAREKYRSDPTDENWNVFVSAGGYARDLASTMGDHVDDSFISEILEEETSERERSRLETDKKEKKQETTRIQSAIIEYMKDKNNPEKRQAAFVAAVEGIEIDPSNPMYTETIRREFPDKDSQAVLEAKSDEVRIKGDYEKLRSRYMDASLEEQAAMKGEMGSLLVDYIDVRKLQGKDVTMLTKEYDSLGLTEQDKADKDAPLSEGEWSDRKSEINDMVINGFLTREQADKLIAVGDLGNTSAEEMNKQLNEMVFGEEKLDKPDKETLDDTKRKYAAKYPAGSPLSLVMQKLSTSDSMGTAIVIDDLMSATDTAGKEVVRSLDDLSEQEIDSLSENVLAWHEHLSSAKGEIATRLDSIPLRSIRSLANIFESYKDVREKLNLITFTVENIANLIGTTTDPEVKGFLVQLDEFLDSDLRIRSGAQTSEPEAARLKKFQPGGKNTLATNDAIFRGLGQVFRNLLAQGLSDSYGNELGEVLSDYAYDRVFEIAKTSHSKSTNFEILPPEASPEQYKAALEKDYAEDPSLVVDYYKGLVQADLDGGMTLEESKAETRKGFEEKMLITGDLLEELINSIYEGFSEEE